MKKKHHLMPVLFFGLTSLISLTFSIGYGVWTTGIVEDTKTTPLKKSYSIEFYVGNNAFYTYSQLEYNSYFEFPCGVTSGFDGWVNPYDQNASPTKYQIGDYINVSGFISTMLEGNRIIFVESINGVTATPPSSL